jgi:pterin-4a-carbinolamine dehydratase
VFSCFFASSIHDLDHPGNNNNYEIAVGSTLAISYNDKAVLENYHLCKAFSLLRKEHCDIYENFSRSNYNSSRAVIINMVLSTDMANHFPDLALTKNRVKAEDFNPAGADKQLMLNQLIHASDISNPVKPIDIYREWVNRVFMEFFDQGDKERQQGLKISYLCDRHTVNVIDSQIGFIDGIVFPLYDILCLAFPNMKMINNLINNNKEEFKRMKDRGEKITI